MKPMILCYNMTGGRAGGIRQVAEGLGIIVRPVQKEEYHQTLAALCGLEDMAGDGCEDPGFEDVMMVLAFFPQGMLSQLLDGIREAGLSPVALKAVLTQSNSRWDSLALHKELQEEHAFFRRRDEARARGKRQPGEEG